MSTINMSLLASAKTIKELIAAGVAEDTIVGTVRTALQSRVKQLEKGKEARQLLATLQANPELLARVKTSASKK
jgi:hypothetical protein